VHGALSLPGGEGKLAEGTLEDVASAAEAVLGSAGPVLRAALVLTGALETVPSNPEEVASAFAAQFRDAHSLWLPDKYLAAFDAIPELKELTTTPFMVRIVVEILRELEHEQSTDASVKQRLHLLLDEAESSS
jgi:uncharacterized protein YbjT (DUF2867 family)